MTSLGTDPVTAFYDRHPYPPPVIELAQSHRLADISARRFEHHLIWPSRALDSVESLLVAGCGTAQAVRHALRHPDKRVVGIDASTTAIDHSRALATHHGVENLELHRLAIEDVGQLGRRFDHIVCTGVLHHLDDPELGLRRLRDVMAPGGAITLMVYARYGRTGIYLIQEYCRRLGLGTSAQDLSGLVSTLRELPLAHPLSRLLRETPDFGDDDALADALLNPRDRAYSVPEIFDLLKSADLRFGRWTRQAPYSPGSGSMSETPHADLIAGMSLEEQYTLMELFRGTITRHTFIAYASGDAMSGALDFTGPDVDGWIPIKAPTAIAVEERLPPGAAAALINQAHVDTDLVLFASAHEYRVFRGIDGRRSVSELGASAVDVVQRLWLNDLVAIEGSGIGGSK